MDPRQLRVLVEFAERGTLRAVAAATGYGTSAVSQQLAGLERAVSVALVERDGRRLRLTPAGRAFLPHARRILAAIDAAVAETGAGTAPSGRIRVAAYGSALATDLLPVALRLRDSHPALRLELYEREPVETLRLVRAGRIDIGLVHEYSLVPYQDRPMTVSEVLCEVPMVLAVPKKNCLLRPDGAAPPGRIGTPADLDVLRGTPWIVNSRGPDDEDAVRRLTAIGSFAPDLAHRVDNLDLAQELVAAGLGVALVPALIRPHPETRLVPITVVPVTRRMRAVTRAGQLNWPGIALVKRLLSEHAQAHLAILPDVGSPPREPGPARTVTLLPAPRPPIREAGQPGLPSRP